MPLRIKIAARKPNNSCHELPDGPSQENRGTGLCFYLLGFPIIKSNDKKWVITRRSVRALLYRLASDPEPVTRDNLHLLFWPDVPEAVARRNLSHHLTHLRQSLPLHHVLNTDRERIWFEPGLIWCDVLQFNKASFDSLNDATSLTQLPGLYRGPFLEGFSLPASREFEHWCTVERVALENQYLRILNQLVNHCTVRGETSQAIINAQRYLEIDPLSETMHQRLIQLYAATGDRHLALQQFERCSSMLESELGVSPLPETWGIYQAVLQGQPRFPKPRAPLHQPKRMEVEIPIIGRKKELGQLEDAFLNLGSRRSQVVLISGEAGIGKSRLMHDFARSKQGYARVLHGTARSGEQAIPYQPVMHALRTVLDLREPGMGEHIERSSPRPSPSDLVEPVWLSEISRLLPEMHSTYPGLPSPLPLDPELARARLFEALCRLTLAYAAARGPLLLCLDDLQWMDALTQAWLVHVGRLLENGRHAILILGTYRSEEAEAILDLRHTLARANVLVEIRLLGLREAAVLQLLQSLTGRKPGEELLARRLRTP
jgi:DNA-binding SARP family transcriptional activator